MLPGLAEADARVQGHLLRIDSFCGQRLQSFLKESADVGDHVVVVRIKLHGGRRALHVHEHDARPEGSRHGSHFGVTCQAADVINDAGADGEALPGDLRLVGVYRDRRQYSSRQFLHDRNDPLQFFLKGDWCGARPGRFTANVEDVRSLLDQRHAMRDCRVKCNEGAAVRETVRRDVDNPHHQRPATNRQYAIWQVPFHTCHLSFVTGQLSTKTHRE